MTEARNDGLREAIVAFAAAPGHETTIDVLRRCLHGQLLLDITGSQLETTDEGQMSAGSTLQIRGGEGPDGAAAMFAFTSQHEIGRLYEDGQDTQSLVQDAADVLALCRAQDSAWLYLDPAGPACALAGADIDFALRVERNDAVRAALEPGADSAIDRNALVAALRADGPLCLAVEAPDLEPGVLQEQAQVQVRTSEAPDGRGVALAAFTSGPEAVARAPQDGIATQPVREIVEQVLRGEFVGLVLNPAGPWAYLPAEELRRLF